MRIFSFLSLSRYIEKIFGPSVAKFFEDFGLYLLIIFVILILYSWAGLFYSLLKPFRRKTNEVTEDKDKFELTISRSILKKVTSIGLIIIALVMGGFIFSTFQVDCEEMNAELSQNYKNYTDKALENINQRQYAIALSYVNELVAELEFHQQFLEDNKNCNTNEINSSIISQINEDLIFYRGIQIQLIAILNN